MSDESDHIDLLAGEYALGLLEGEERADAARRADADPAFAARVDFWNDRFAVWLDGLQERPAPAWIKARIEAEIFGAPTPARPASGAGFWSSLAVWRGLTAAGFAAAAFAFAVLLLRPPEIVERIEVVEVEVEVPVEVEAPAPPPGVVLVAALQPVEVDPAVLAVYDETEGLISLSGAVGVGEPGDTELWIIPEGRDPVSLGVIARDGARSVTVPEQLIAEFQAGSALAISLEPEGGSPTGAPTGPILALGPLNPA
ncbi:anti-sigma factor [Glycocaulis profundi]|nr:anti-sigma factor [Glycocaulis profundi]